mgnify:CR=1 FL=1
MRILMTGFTPFPGVDVNPTQLLLRYFQDETVPLPAGVQLIPEILLTAFETAEFRIRQLIRDGDTIQVGVGQPSSLMFKAGAFDDAKHLVHREQAVTRFLRKFGRSQRQRGLVKSVEFARYQAVRGEYQHPAVAEAGVIGIPDPIAGEYVVGWIKRGPRGIIGTNKPDSQETVDVLLEDLHAGNLHKIEVPPRAVLERLLSERRRDFVSYEDWQLIDLLEQERGRASGDRPRVKFSRVEEMRSADYLAEGHGLAA